MNVFEYHSGNEVSVSVIDELFAGYCCYFIRYCALAVGPL